jgi:hypothetical protein
MGGNKDMNRRSTSTAAETEAIMSAVMNFFFFFGLETPPVDGIFLNFFQKRHISPFSEALFTVKQIHHPCGFMK